MILPHESSYTAGEAGAPVFGGLDLFEFVGLSGVGQALIDQLPSAFGVGADLAAVFAGATAGAV